MAQSATGDWLGINNGPMDAILYQGEDLNNIYAPCGFIKTKNTFKTHKDITPVNNSETYVGKEVIFDVPRGTDLIGDCEILYDVDPIAVPGDGTYARCVDYFAFFNIDYIEVVYASNHIQTIRPAQLISDHRRRPTLTDRDAINECVAGDKTVAERDALALTSQEVILRVPFAWAARTDYYLPVFSLSDTVKIHVKFKPAEDWIETDGVTKPVPVIKNLKLRIAHIHMEESERLKIFGISQTDGIFWLWNQTKYQEFYIPIGTKGYYALQLKNFNTSTRRCGFIIRKEADLITPWAKNYVDWQKAAHWYLEGSSGRLTEPISHKYQVFSVNKKYHHAPVADEIALYGHNFSENPDVDTDAFGSMQFHNITNTTLQIDFGDVPTTERLVVTVIVDEYNGRVLQGASYFNQYR